MVRCAGAVVAFDGYKAEEKDFSRLKSFRLHLMVPARALRVFQWITLMLSSRFRFVATLRLRKPVGAAKRWINRMLQSGGSPRLVPVRPNVRAEAGPTAKRQARVVENAPAHCAGLVF